MKTCKKCNQELEDSSFTVVGYGPKGYQGKKYLDSHCKPCRYVVRKERTLANGAKDCYRCGINKPADQFYPGDSACHSCRDLYKTAAKQSRKPRDSAFEQYSKTPPPNLAYRNILWDDEAVNEPPYVIPKISDVLTVPVQGLLSGRWT
jgi:hypothetical protein